MYVIDILDIIRPLSPWRTPFSLIRPASKLLSSDRLLSSIPSMSDEYCSPPSPPCPPRSDDKRCAVRNPTIRPVQHPTDTHDQTKQDK